MNSRDDDAPIDPVDAQKPPPPPFAEAADAEISLKGLLVDLPAYGRRFAMIARAPFQFPGRMRLRARGGQRRAIVFMIQGITVAFILFTLSWLAPRTLSGFLAGPAPIVAMNRGDLGEYQRRLEAVRSVMPAALAEVWPHEDEFIYIVRLLPPAEFDRLLRHIERVAASDPDLLEQALRGTFTHGNRFGGRGYILAFFAALHPVTGPLLKSTGEMVRLGSHYELPPHLDTLLRHLVIWYVVASVTCWLLPKSAGKTPVVFGLVAYLVGFFAPVLQGCALPLHVYLAGTLGRYAALVCPMVDNAAPPQLFALTGGLFPLENVLILAVRTIPPLVAAILAATALARGLRSIGGFATGRAVPAALAGLGMGLGCAEILSNILGAVVAATGLV